MNTEWSTFLKYYVSKNYQFIFYNADTSMRVVSLEVFFFSKSIARKCISSVVYSSEYSMSL